MRRRIAHEPLARSAGLSQAQLSIIRDESTALSENVDPHALLSVAQLAALTYADWVTKKIHVPHAIFKAVKAHFNDQQIVEITVTISAYNMVSRVLVALDVGDKADMEVPQA